MRQQCTRCKEEPTLQTPQQATRLSAWVAGLDQLRLTCRELGMHDEECSKLQSEVLSWAVGSGLPANGGRPESVGTGSPSAVPEVFTGQLEAVPPYKPAGEGPAMAAPAFAPCQCDETQPRRGERGSACDSLKAAKCLAI